MQDAKFITLSASERELLQEALTVFAESTPARRPEIRLLFERLMHRDPNHPDVTVGVYGGLVQWVIGNPFPIRICDYDGDEGDLPDVDAQGQRCNTWLEPPSM